MDKIYWMVPHYGLVTAYFSIFFCNNTLLNCVQFTLQYNTMKNFFPLDLAYIFMIYPCLNLFMYSFGFCTFVYFKVGKGGVWLKNQFVYLLSIYLSIDLRNEKKNRIKKMQYWFLLVVFL